MASAITPAALHALATGTALRGLSREAHLLDVIADRPDAEALMEAQLVEGQFNCAGQLRTVSIFALRCVMPAIGREWSLANWGNGIDDLRTQMRQATKDILAVGVADFADATTRTVQHKAGDAVLTQSVEDYLVQFAVPNLWFHLSMAYAILRAAGVPVGKADFDGLHAYPDGFSFV